MSAEETNKEIADQDRAIVDQDRANTDQDRVNTDKDRADAVVDRQERALIVDYNEKVAVRIEKLDRSLESVHETLKAEGVKRDKRIRTNRIAIILAGLAAALGILVGAFGINAVNESNAERDSARIASCLQYNKQQDVQIAAEIAQSHDFVDALAQSSTDPDIREKVRLYNEPHDQLIKGSHPKQNCSPAGIDKYLNAK